MRQPLGDYDEHYDDGFELVGEQRVEEPARGERRLPTLLISIVAMVVFAGGLWFAYHEGTRHAGSSATSGGVPLIRAEQQPDKIKPPQPGGMQIPDQNVSIYNEKPGVAPVERLLPPPEKPMPRPAPEPQQAIAPPAPPSGPAQPSPQIAAAPPAAAPAQPAAPIKPAAPARPVRTPPTEAAKTGPVLLQLSSVRTPDEARTAWARMKQANADLLGSVKGEAVRKDLGDKGIFYRIEAGPFRDAAVATRVCGELKQRGLGCILAR